MITEAFAAEAAAPKLDPLHHFAVQTILPIHLFGLDFSISNSVIWMWLAVAAAFGFFRYCFSTPSLVPSRAQSVGEMSYGFVYGIVKDIIGKEGEIFFPYILALFFFILSCNWLGLLPFSFTPTAQIIVTITLAGAVFIVSTAIGFVKHGAHFLHFFVPSGVPVLVLPLIVPIEMISYLARPVSLSVRLFANMTAGHTIIATMLFFTATLPWFGSWLPLSFAVMISGAELGIGAIQAYIFTVLTCVYINDALHMH